MSIFDNGGLEFFKFELLTLQSGLYKHSEWITEYVEKCSIDIDFERTIITGANLQLKQLDDIDFLKDLIQVYYCFIVNGVTYEIPLGRYMLLSPEKNCNKGYVSRNVSGYDLLKALDQDKLTTSTTYSSGTNVVTLIESIISSVGTWANYLIEPNSATLSTDVSYEINKSKLFVINSLLNMINYQPLWADGNGTYRAIPWVALPNIVHEFIDNDSSLYEDNVDTYVDLANIYNTVVVINNQLEPDTAPLYKEWSFSDEGLNNHPFSASNLGRTIPEVFFSDSVSQTIVDSRARRELRKMLEIEEAIKYNHAFVTSRLSDGIPWQNDAYKFKHTLLELDSTYRIVKQSYELKTGVTVKSLIKRVKLT